LFKSILKKDDGVAAIGLITAGGAFGQSEMPTLKMALAVADMGFNLTPNSVFNLADDLGIFKKHGVKVEFITLDGTPQAVAALNSGAVDIADITIDSMLRLRAENDVQLRGFLANGKGGSFLIVGKDEIESVADLAGHSFAIADSGSLDHNLTVAMLQATNSEAPNFVAIGAPDVRVQALAAGRIDATTVSFGTYLSIADTPGIHIIMNTDELGKFTLSPTKLISAMESTLETKGDAIQRFTNAVVETARRMHDNPDEWVEAAAAARDDLSRERIEAIANFIKAQWCLDACMDEGNLTNVVDYIYNNPDFENVTRIPAEDVLEFRFAQKANETLGPYTPPN